MHPRRSTDDLFDAEDCDDADITCSHHPRPLRRRVMDIAQLNRALHSLGMLASSAAQGLAVWACDTPLSQAFAALGGGNRALALRFRPGRDAA